MKYLLTICSDDKDPRPEPLPARERYQSDFMQQVIAEGERTDTRVLILSGKFGILEPDDEIPYYDHQLTEEEVDNMVPTVAEQLEERMTSKLVAYIKKGREVEGWEPYYQLIEKSAAAIGAELTYAELPEPTEPRSETTKLR